MRIGLVCPYDMARPGGVQVHVLELARQLTQRNHSVAIIAPGRPNHGWEDIEVFDTGFMRPVSIFGTRFELSWMDNATRKRFRAFLAEKQFEILHFHTFWAPLMPLQIRLASRSTHIITFHDTPASGRLHDVLRFFMHTLSRTISLFFHRFISVSPSQSGYVKAGRLKKVHVIPNGINTDVFKPKSPIDRHLTPPFLLFLGRFEPRKGARYALEVFSTLSREFPDLELVMAGDGEERHALEKWVAEKGLRGIRFAGRVSEEEKIRLLQTASVVLAPALYGESFGIILLEAMAAETPVAGFGNSGYLNLAVDYAPELFPEPGDTEQLTAAVASVLQKPELFQQLVETGRLMARLHDWKNIAAGIERHYETALRWNSGRS